MLTLLPALFLFCLKPILSEIQYGNRRNQLDKDDLLDLKMPPIRFIRGSNAAGISV